MTLAGLSERAAADKQEVLRHQEPSRSIEHIRNMIKIGGAVKGGGGCYMMPDFSKDLGEKVTNPHRHQNRGDGSLTDKMDQLIRCFIGLIYMPLKSPRLCPQQFPLLDHSYPTPIIFHPGCYLMPIGAMQT